MHTRRTALTAIGALYAMATGSPASAQAAFPDRRSRSSSRYRPVAAWT